MKQLPELKDFLLCETPASWVSAALQHPEVLLIDHAHCEKKAAATALNLMFRYVDKVDLLNKMSRLAREELRHFEQVLAIMVKRGIEYSHLSPSRYAGELRKLVRTHEPARLVDTLIVGAFIEARSCERFEKLAPYLDEELTKFYLSLLKSESRHFQDYLTLAIEAAGEPIDERVALFAEKEQALVLALDDEFRFHSGPLEAVTAES
ncbi:tRNA-(ms[2]io[6]A)-hydroxylase [Endozoicomonas sp. SM1973]|uniref:tRNA-(Ms[2]io[6]A)-hydroxylase n=1 Tax=Spartinivicinus marinus TaxID=2994442 RepID=A0A853IG74_9GAMM|nr:tRNA isopentenyl-2-thiomethyl-A-37 hydroxylase MiaE [Spartinivicinus marinus]MCX4024821.1 tRNA-(ms[2]io[6]A)-hydroxylase [Spartinivicinus marinus]NYZ66536.1 tRNA-(ms[2]io[6]A)-hydroxylase [Spartinivicinus marinus]